ncbi:MAG TPA: hypothetical protein VKV17_08975 [Bryobacteraceae bacterium]|nr:hypothetical protein [Bryobacteraceae bacterium]
MNAEHKLGIRFNDCVFSEPAPLAQWSPPRCACLYTILVADPNWAPKPYQPLYFGEFGNNAAGQLLEKAREFAASLPGKDLFVAVLPIPFSTTAQRWMLRNELVWAYNPPYPTPVGENVPATELARKLEELERRHQEETAQLRLMLFANAHPRSEPLRPRRRFGFYPASENAA